MFTYKRTARGPPGVNADIWRKHTARETTAKHYDAIEPEVPVTVYAVGKRSGALSSNDPSSAASHTRAVTAAMFSSRNRDVVNVENLIDDVSAIDIEVQQVGDSKKTTKKKHRRSKNPPRRESQSSSLSLSEQEMRPAQLIAPEERRGQKENRRNQRVSHTHHSDEKKEQRQRYRTSSADEIDQRRHLAAPKLPKRLVDVPLLKESKEYRSHMRAYDRNPCPSTLLAIGKYLVGKNDDLAEMVFLEVLDTSEGDEEALKIAAHTLAIFYQTIREDVHEANYYFELSGGVSPSKSL